MRKFNPATLRTRQIAAIHVIAQKQLRLDRSTYVALLQRVGGASSAADLDAKGRVQVLRELGRLAGDSDKHMSNAIALPDAPQNVRDEIASMVAKIGAILAEIDKPWSYAHGTARKMFRAQRVEWLRADQLHRLVAALQISANRRK